MSFEKAQIVRSLKGHDSGQLFCIMDVEEGRLLLADGKRRRVERPKRKNDAHVVLLEGAAHPTLENVRMGRPVRNKELRAALAVIRDTMEV